MHGVDLRVEKIIPTLSAVYVVWLVAEIHGIIHKGSTLDPAFP